MKMGIAAGAALALSGTFPKFSWANVRTVSYEECLEMDALAIADNSQLVTDSYHYLINTAQGIKNKAIKKKVLEVLHNPAPTFAGDLQDRSNRRQVYDELKAKGFIKEIAFDAFLPPLKENDKSPFPFYAGSGSGYSGHHSYPGGLATHVAFNSRMATSLCDNYSKAYSCILDHDIALAAELLHDLTKPWVFQWTDSGESRTELQLAGTGEHHTYSVAESIVRGLPVEICVAQACAHEHPGFAKEEKKPVAWLTVAAILAGKDPIRHKLLAADGQTLPQPRRMENFVCHLADHDWVISAPAAKWIIPEMEKIALTSYGLKQDELKTRKFNQLRNYVFAQASIMELYQVFSTRGEDGLADSVRSIVPPPKQRMFK